MFLSAFNDELIKVAKEEIPPGPTQRPGRMIWGRGTELLKKKYEAAQRKKRIERL
ncbi:hypothetical protein LCGC14_1018260, partial [marine sediment metagenome]